MQLCIKFSARSKRLCHWLLTRLRIHEQRPGAAIRARLGAVLGTCGPPGKAELVDERGGGPRRFVEPTVYGDGRGRAGDGALG